MMSQSPRRVPENHPIRALFQTLTERGLDQTNLHDADTARYVANLLTEFVDVDHMDRILDESGRRPQYLFEMIGQAGEARSAEARRECYRHLGDWTLFNLGLFPESLSYGRKLVSPSFYAEQGRRSYTIVASMETSRATLLFRKLSEQFEQCVVGLNWVKLYINDPFYQYVFREFKIT